MNDNSSLPPISTTPKSLTVSPWHIWLHAIVVGIGLLTLNLYQAYDLFWLNHAFQVSGFGMAIGAMVGGSALGAGGLAWGVSNFLGSGGGQIEGG